MLQLIILCKQPRDPPATGVLPVKPPHYPPGVVPKRPLFFYLAPSYTIGFTGSECTAHWLQ
jgi:hypothetical protein